MPTGLNAAVFPSAVVLLMTASLSSIYIISVIKGDVAPFWPYISDGGVLYPESNIFAQLLDMSSFAAFGTFCIRYRLVKDVLSDLDIYPRRLNLAALIIGSLSVFGMTLVGNFQEDKPDHVHFVGAALLFVLGTLYTILDSILTFRTLSSTKSTKIFISRVAIATISIIFIATTFVGKFVSEGEWKHTYPDENVTDKHERQRHWGKDNPAYNIHVLGSTSEWVVGLTYILYFITFIGEFVKFKCSVGVAQDGARGNKEEIRPLLPH